MPEIIFWLACMNTKTLRVTDSRKLMEWKSSNNVIGAGRSQAKNSLRGHSNGETNIMDKRHTDIWWVFARSPLTNSLAWVWWLKFLFIELLPKSAQELVASILWGINWIWLRCNLFRFQSDYLFLFMAL